MLLIRRPTVGERDVCLALVGRMINHGPYAAIFPIDPGRLELLVDWFISEQLVLVAALDDMLVGIVAGIAADQPWSGVRVMEEAVWYVEPEHRAGSIGPRLLRGFEEESLRFGCAMVKMVAPQASTVGTYLGRHGYVPLETVYTRNL